MMENNDQHADRERAERQSDETAIETGAEETDRQYGGPSQRQPDDTAGSSGGGGMASASDAFVARDGEGNLQAVETEVPGQGVAELIPMTYGDAEEYLGDAGDFAMLGADKIAEIMRNHIKSPDFEAYCRDTFGRRPGKDHALTGYVVSKEMEPFVPQAYLMELLEVSGLSATVDMHDDGTASVSLDTDAEGNLTQPGQ